MGSDLASAATGQKYSCRDCQCGSRHWSLSTEQLSLSPFQTAQAKPGVSGTKLPSLIWDSPQIHNYNILHFHSEPAVLHLFWAGQILHLSGSCCMARVCCSKLGQIKTKGIKEMNNIKQLIDMFIFYVSIGVGCFYKLVHYIYIHRIIAWWNFQAIPTDTMMGNLNWCPGNSGLNKKSHKSFIKLTKIIISHLKKLKAT